MTSTVSIHNSKVTYPDDTGINCLPDDVLKIVFDYDSCFSISLILSKICPRWMHCEKQLALRKWEELKKECQGYQRMLLRMDKIEKRFFSEGAMSWFERLERRTERALRLTGLTPEEVIAIRDSQPIEITSSSCLFQMEAHILAQHDQNLEGLWQSSLSIAAHDLHANNWNAVQIRTWLAERGNIYNYADGLSLKRSNPKIRGIPPELSQFISLERLWFSQNRITFVPSSIGELPSLKHLDLRDNPLIKLPNALEKLFAKEDFTLVLDKKQFLQFYDQLNLIYPEAPWYVKLASTILIFFEFALWIISCGFSTFDLNHYTRDEIEALDDEKINSIWLSTNPALYFEPFFSRRFWVNFNG